MPDSLKPLYIIINNTNGYIEESNGNKCLILIPLDAKTSWKNIKIFLDQQVMTQVIMMENVWKSNSIVIITVGRNDCRIHFWGMTKTEAENKMKNSALSEKREQPW